MFCTGAVAQMPGLLRAECFSSTQARSVDELCSTQRAAGSPLDEVRCVGLPSLCSRKTPGRHSLMGTWPTGFMASGHPVHGRWAECRNAMVEGVVEERHSVPGGWGADPRGDCQGDTGPAEGLRSEPCPGAGLTSQPHTCCAIPGESGASAVPRDPILRVKVTAKSSSRQSQHPPGSTFRGTQGP